MQRTFAVAILESLEIGEGGVQQARIVVEMTNAEVASTAEQAADLAGDVAMVDAQGLRAFLAADGACAALALQQRLVLLDRYSVMVLEMVLALAWARTASRFPFGMLRPAQPPPFSDLFLVGGAPGPIAGENPLSVLRILCIALFLDPSPARSH